MNTQRIFEYERRKLEKFQNRLFLPNNFKRIGIILFIVSFIFFFGVAIFTDGNDVIKVISRNVILISLLLITLSKEKIEDELIEKLRGQAFSFAFITGVLFAIMQPYINYFVAALVKPEKAIFEQLGDFVILWFMLVMYLCFFHTLKRTS